jgi:hypothetical protein
MNQLSLRYNMLKFKTLGEFLIDLEGSMEEYTLNEWKQNRTMSTCNRLDSKSTNYAQKTSWALVFTTFARRWPKGRFTVWPKVERPLISTNQIARNQEFGLSTLHTMAKVQRPSQFEMINLLRRRRTLEGSLGRTGMETQTMVKRPSIFFH